MEEPNQDTPPTDVLAQKVVSLLQPALHEHISQAIDHQNRQLLEEHRTMKPLLCVGDVARTLQVSMRTVETLIAGGKLRPLWIRGVRRFHPDTVSAYLRSCEKKRSSRRRRTITPGK
ncbi:unnamed protein product [Laminaria digitata]